MHLNRHRITRSLDFPLEAGQLLILEPAGQQELDPKVYRSYNERLSLKGYKLLYLPYIVNAMSTDAIRYYVPGYASKTSIDDIQSRVSSTLGLEVRSPLVITRKHGNLIVIEPGESGATTETLLSSLLDELPQNNVREPIIGKILVPVCGSVCDSALNESVFSEVNSEVNSESNSEFKPDPKSYPKSDPNLAEETLNFIMSLSEEELRKFGMSEKLLQAILAEKGTSLSRVRINKYGKIILEDYSNEEISMDTKTKTLYFLYLRHPEGLAIKELPEYKEEAYDLYQSISNRDDIKAQRAAIDNLLDPCKEDVNVCLSRIKSAFLKKMSESNAKNYYVQGERGEKRKIPIDQSMVIWETIR